MSKEYFAFDSVGTVYRLNATEYVEALEEALRKFGYYIEEEETEDDIEEEELEETFEE